MSIKEYLEKMKTLQSDFLKFIEDNSNTEDNYQNLTSYIIDQKILDSQILALYFILLTTLQIIIIEMKTFLKRLRKLLIF